MHAYAYWMLRYCNHSINRVMWIFIANRCYCILISIRIQTGLANRHDQFVVVFIACVDQVAYCL